MKVPKMKDPPTPENSMAQANADYDRWKDARDVEKGFEEWFNLQFTGKEDDPVIVWGIFSERHLKAFAKFYAQRCGVVLDSECDHPYHSVVGGNGSPERCLTCGKVLSI